MSESLNYRRSLGQLVRAIYNPMHFRALRRAFVYEHPVRTLLWRYILGRGRYPTTVRIHSLGSNLDIGIRSHYDLLTVQEVFLWECYPCKGDERLILDLGANIGVSMLYFLSRAPNCEVIGVEPLQYNYTQAELNLEPYSDRVRMINAAVMNYSGTVDLGVEATGRYSGIAFTGGQVQTVECLHINSLVHEALATNSRINLVKVDVEGAEGPILRGLSDELFERIDALAIEGEDIPFERMVDLGFLHHRHASGVHWFQRPGDARLCSAQQRARQQPLA